MVRSVGRSFVPSCVRVGEWSSDSFSSIWAASLSWCTLGSKPPSQLVVAGPVTRHDEIKLLRKVQITKPRNRLITENEQRNEIPTYDLAQRLTN